MCYGTVVLCSIQANDCWILHGNAEQTGKDSFNRGVPIVYAFEIFSFIINFFSNAGSKAN